MKIPWKALLAVLVAALGAAGYFGYKLLLGSRLPGPDIHGKVEELAFPKDDLAEYGIDQDLKLKIFLPEGYDSTNNYYPVVFVLDGDNLFEGAAGYLSQMIAENAVPKAILVGIGYGYRNGYLAKKGEGRWRDYSLPEDPEFGQNANAPGFYQFLSNLLVPTIMETYHGLRNQSTLIGHSMGGDFAYYAFLQYTPALHERNPFTAFVIGDGGNEQHFVDLYMPRFEKRMFLNHNVAHTPLTVYRIWGYKTGAEGIRRQEALHQWLAGRNFKNINAYRYYPLNDDHAATMKTTIVNGIKLGLGAKGFMDYPDKSGFHF